MKKEMLIVDDAPFIREMLRNAAEKMGWIVVGEAEDGEQAVAFAETLKPQAMILDLVLPKLNGVDAAKLILEKNKNIKILACSTESEKEMMLKALQVGCVAFVAKPFSIADLKEKLEVLQGED